MPCRRSAKLRRSCLPLYTFQQFFLRLADPEQEGFCLPR